MDAPQKPTPSAQAMLNAIRELEARGFEPDGHTATQEVRVATSRSPVFGGIGGERRTFGGRARFRIPNTDIRATVGKRSTCLYHAKGDFLATIETKDLAALRAALERHGLRAATT